MTRFGIRGHVRGAIPTLDFNRYELLVLYQLLNSLFTLFLREAVIINKVFTASYS
jgi:hypothetical protein